jgi:cell division inhibitor SepF
MSFWDNVKKFAQPYADDDYDDYDEDEEFVDEYEEPAAPARRAPVRRRAAEPAPVEDLEDEDDDFGFGLAAAAPKAAPVTTTTTGFKGQVVSMATGAKQEVVLFRPTSFNDTSKAADDLRNRKAVLLNLENVDKAMSRRVVDFLSGCVYAVDGSVKKVAQSAYIFCPHNMDVVGDLEALQAEVENYI